MWSLFFCCCRVDITTRWTGCSIIIEKGFGWLWKHVKVIYILWLDELLDAEELSHETFWTNQYYARHSLPRTITCNMSWLFPYPKTCWLASALWSELTALSLHHEQCSWNLYVDIRYYQERFLLLCEKRRMQWRQEAKLVSRAPHICHLLCMSFFCGYLFYFYRLALIVLLANCTKRFSSFFSNAVFLVSFLLMCALMLILIDLVLQV